MAALLAAVAPSTSQADEASVKKAEKEKAKFKVRMNNHLKKTKALKDKIEALGDCDDMSEQEIRKNLLDSKDWEKKVDALMLAKEGIEEETVEMARSDFA